MKSKQCDNYVEFNDLWYLVVQRLANLPTTIWVKKTKWAVFFKQRFF